MMANETGMLPGQFDKTSFEGQWADLVSVWQERAEREGLRMEMALAHLVIEAAETAGTGLDLASCHQSWNGLHVVGIAFRQDTGELDLMVHLGNNPQETLSQDQVRMIAGAAIGLVQAAASALEAGAHDLQPAVAFLLEQISGHAIREIRLRLLLPDCQDGFTARIETELPCNIEGWGKTNLLRLMLGQTPMPIDLDLPGSGYGPMDAVEAPPLAGSRVRTFVTMLPGKLLADLYGRYGNDLNDENVRAYLGSSGRINKGIQGTLRDQAQMFVNYNNGLTMTASACELEEQGGRTRLLTLGGIQIINGGQTTASLYYAARDGVDLRDVRIVAKICVVQPGVEFSEEVANISRYSNTQNRVSTSDFGSHAPMWLRVKHLSMQTEFANPDPDGLLPDTRWYFDRLQNAYRSEELALGNGPELRRFRTRNPAVQRINKLDIARSELVFDRKAWVVCRGNEKLYKEYAEPLNRNWASEQARFDGRWYREVVGKTIVLRAVVAATKGDTRGTGNGARAVAYGIGLAVERLRSLGLAVDFRRISARGQASGVLVEGLRQVVLAVLPDIRKAADSDHKSEDFWRTIRENFTALPLSEDMLVADDLMPVTAPGRALAKARRSVLDTHQAATAQGIVAALGWGERQDLRAWIAADDWREARFGAMADAWLSLAVGEQAMPAAESLTLLTIRRLMAS